LQGHVIVYAKIQNPESPENKKHPVYEMTRSGIMAATGDYRTQHNLGDFLKKELGITLDDLGKSENIHLTGFPEHLNPDILKKKIDSLKGFEELIPTPAKMELFESEQEILGKDADVFYLGEFERLANANLAINAFPILYQSVYREQISNRVSQEIEKMISQATKQVNAYGHYLDNPGELEKKIQTVFLSELIYHLSNPTEREAWIQRFRNFMAGYKYPGEVDKIITLAVHKESERNEIRQLIELCVKKIGAFLREDYKEMGVLKKKIESLDARIN